jgi:hypothetical protein
MLRKLLVAVLLSAVIGAVTAQEQPPLPADLPVIGLDNADQVTALAQLGRGWIGDIAWADEGEAILAAGLTGVAPCRRGADG